MAASVQIVEALESSLVAFAKGRARFMYRRICDIADLYVRFRGGQFAVDGAQFETEARMVEEDFCRSDSNRSS